MKSIIGNTKFIILIYLISCNSAPETPQDSSFSIKIRVNRFPSSINYLTSTSALGGQIQAKTFNKILTYSSSLEIKPLLVINIPALYKVDSMLALDYEIRPEAKWNNQKPITSEDIEFSLKVFKLPVESNRLSSTYYDRIKGIQINPDNFRKFTLLGVGNEEAFKQLTGDFGILQKSHFDPQGLLDQVTFTDIINNPEQVKQDSLAQNFINNIISDPFKFNEKYFSSSGPYKISSMEDGRSIVLEKNKQWWGHSITQSFEFINASPDKIIYYTIPETLSAIQALKNSKIDVMPKIPASEFYQLEQDNDFLENYSLHTPSNFRFSYIGINSRKELLKNKKFRQALAHLLDKEEIIQIVEKSYAVSTIGPINPVLSYYYHDEIESYAYDLYSAEILLAEAELEKKNNLWYKAGSSDPIELDLLFRQSSQSETIAQVFQSQAKKIGLQVRLVPYDNRTMFKKINSRNYDLFIGALGGSPFSYDYSGVFGVAASKAGGLNHTGFGNTKSDSLIQAVNFAKDSVERRDALFGLQEMLHDEATMLFLYFYKNTIAISKKFTNLKISSMRPGYDVTAFELVDN